MAEKTIDQLSQEIESLRNEIKNLRKIIVTKPELRELLINHFSQSGPDMESFQESITKVAHDLFNQFTANRDSRGVVFMPSMVTDLLKTACQVPDGKITKVDLNENSD